MGRAGHAICLAAGALALAASFGMPAVAAAQTALPSGFADQLVIGNLSTPTAFDFVPGGRVLFVEQKNATVRLLVNGAIAATDPVITVPNVRISGAEQGLLGIALDPQFPARPYIYVHCDDSQSLNVRISRFTLTGDLAGTGNGSMTADPASRLDIIRNVPDNASNHNGGTVRFGPDGALYASFGEDAQECQAQTTGALQGVILRMRVDQLGSSPGTVLRSQIIPANNPLATSPDSNACLVLANGLRNPFRFQLDPGAPRLVIGDVGQVSFEEVDLLDVPRSFTEPAPPLVNFGWPFFEGNSSYTTCAGVPTTGFTPPIFDYDRASGRSVMSAGVYRPVTLGLSSWPATYDGDVFASDYYSGFLRRLKFEVTIPFPAGHWFIPPAEPGQPSAANFGTGFDAVSDWRVGPDGALWYLRQAIAFQDGTGQLRRIAYVGGPPPPPPPPDSVVAVTLSVYPLPAVGSVNLSYRLPDSRNVTITLYDSRGRRVRHVVGGLVQPAARYDQIWDGRDDEGKDAPAGVYYLRLQASGTVLTRAIPLIR